MLTRYDDIEQGSEKWHELRSKYLMTASRTPIVMGLSPFSDNEKLAKEIKFDIKPFYSAAMKQGNDLEDMVRLRVNEILEDTFMPSVGVNKEMLASLDGINFNEDTIIEIKVSEKTYDDLENGVIPEHYLWQIKHQMQVFDIAERAFLCAYSVKRDAVIISDPIVKDDEFKNDFFKIVNAWNEFKEFMSNYELEEIDNIQDPNALLLANELFELNEQKKALEVREKEIKAELQTFISAKKTMIGNLTISKQSGRKTVDYTKMINDLEISKDKLAEYTKQGKESIAFRFSK